MHAAMFKMDQQLGPAERRRELGSVSQQPGWEGSVGESGYTYVSG